ncbi:periplasmic-type flagellar collar protein FlbB [Treponema lecithinolyticum]|uniref:periplasmic-type flagellar collar protein FlbB n=1 Tax=Treponema lecithinolyticum TaxID=53418 RepID=UPI0028EB61E6|nr:flagellar protein FlbB [Treponema lecithinolyticum]
MARGVSIGKTLAMLVLILILILGGMLWFDYLGVLNAKKIFAPVYRLFGLQVQTSVSDMQSDASLTADLDEDRLAKRLEALNVYAEELDKREQDIAAKEAENLQITQKLEEMRVALEEREKTFNNEVKKYDDRNVNIEQNAKNLNSMRPADAVEILNAMDDQDVIDTLRKVEEMAVAAGKNSQVSNWLSMMPPERVAALQRKMTNKPLSIQ